MPLQMGHQPDGAFGNTWFKQISDESAAERPGFHARAL